MRAIRAILRAAGYGWAAPYTALGLALGMIVVLAGGRMKWHMGAAEFGGGQLGRLAAHLPAPFSFSAITLGHVILGIDEEVLAAVRLHEQVHVRQYERWGLLFGPAYLLSSLSQWALGRRPYRDNHFEREAYAKAGAGLVSCNETASRVQSPPCPSPPPDHAASNRPMPGSG